MQLHEPQPPAIYRKAAIVLSLLWAALVLGYGFGHLGGGIASVVMTLLAMLVVLIVPIAALWGLERLASSLAQTNAKLMALDAEVRQRAGVKPALPDMRPVEELGQRVSKLEALEKQVADLAALPRPAHAPQPDLLAAPEEAAPETQPHQTKSPDSQPELPIFEPPGDVTLSRPQIVRALNFPQNAEDTDGFAVLRQALASRDLAQLLQAAEDCLNFLSQDALYMDDLLIAPASADDWRAFAKGGRARASLLPMQGIRDEEALAQVRTRMRADPIFRDTALVLQRRFDDFLTVFAAEADDSELLDLMNTRTGRAFVLFAQVNGSLD